MKTDEYDTYYAIGDVHGCAGLMYELLEAIDDDIRKTKPSRPVVIFLGDLVDRGPSSYEVVDFLMHGWRYNFPLIVCRGNHECHHPDTECLTDVGWLPHDKIDPNKHKVYSLNPETGEGVWTRILEYVEYDFNGDMIEVDNARGISLCVTPNHRVLATKRKRHKNVRFYVDSEMQYVTASNLGDDVWGIPTSAKTTHGGCSLTDDEIRFIAWVLTDGGIRFTRSSPTINIWQSKEHDVIRNLLTNMGMHFSERVRSRHISSICGKKLKSPPLPEHVFRILKPSHEYALSLVQEKGVIPQAIWECDDRQFEIFLSTVIQADGSWASTCGEIKTSGAIYKDVKFLDQMERLCVQHGWSANISSVSGRTEKRLNVSKTFLRTVSPEKLSKKPYNGKVWCLRVPMGNFMIRRNGFSHFSGNSMTYASKFFGDQKVYFDESKWLDPNHHFYDRNALMSYLGYGHELASHLNWFASLPCYVETPTFLFVHAGLPPESLYENEDVEDTEPQHAFKYSMTRDVDDCAKYDLMWIRGEFLRYEESHYRYVVHGHTPHKTAPHILHNRLNLDSGAVWSGRLSCAKLMESRPYQVEIFYTETNRYRETNVYKKAFFIPVNKDQVHQFPVMNLNQNLGY